MGLNRVNQFIEKQKMLPIKDSIQLTLINNYQICLHNDKTQ